MSVPKPRVHRERDRFEQLERDSREKIGVMPPRAPHHRKSGSISSSSGSPSQQSLTFGSSVDRPTVAYPNYYDFTEDLDTHSQQQQQQQQDQQQQLQLQLQEQQPHSPKRNMANMAMQVPIQPQQPPQQRLVDTKTTPVTTAQIAQAARAAGVHSSSHQRGSSAASRDQLPSYSGSQQQQQQQQQQQHNAVHSSPRPRSPGDEILPPNKVDIDAARYRHAQQQQSRRERDRDRERERERDRDRENKDRENRRVSLSGGRISSSSNSTGMGPLSLQQQQQHHHHNVAGGRPISPESPMLTPTGPNIQRLPTPSIPNSVLQPLDTKIIEYSTLMTKAQGDLARIDEEMRVLQERQREAEQHFLEAKAKHDDYRRQYSDVERALRGEFINNNNNNNHDHHNGRVDARDHGHDVPPVPSMSNLQHYGGDAGPGQNSRHGSGNLLGGQQQQQQQQLGPPHRTVSSRSDLVSQDSVRTNTKRGRFSRLFGI